MRAPREVSASLTFGSTGTLRVRAELARAVAVAHNRGMKDLLFDSIVLCWRRRRALNRVQRGLRTYLVYCG